MVKVKFGKEQFDALHKCEKFHHNDIWQLILTKLSKQDELQVLDVSDHVSPFGVMLAEKSTNNRLTVLNSTENPSINLNNVKFEKGAPADASKHGKFDVIIINEATHNFGELDALFKNLKEALADKGQIVLFSHPKNPPLPIPDVCVTAWSRLAVSKEQLLAAADSARLHTVSFSAAVPVSLDKTQWELILQSGCYASVRETDKCDEKMIHDHCVAKSGKFEFEEKMLVMLLRA